VHAVANLQSTFANTSTLKLTYPNTVTLQPTMGISVGQEYPAQAPGGNFELNIPLGSLQYGQSRDIYLRWKSSSTDSDIEPSFLNVALQYNKMTEAQHVNHASRDLMDLSFTSLSDAEIASQVSRSRICAFLSELFFPIDALGEHRLNPNLECPAGLAEKQQQLRDLIASLPAAHFPDDPMCVAFMQDLAGAEPLGQVSLALSRDKYLTRYVPTGRLASSSRLMPASPTAISMRAYNSSSVPCFAGRTPVRLANNKYLRISSLRRGHIVATPAGPRKVAAVLLTPVHKYDMVRLGDVLVTPWHPVALPTDLVDGLEDGHGWVFPAKVQPGKLVRYTGAIYSVLLERDGDIDAHAIYLGGRSDESLLFWGVTLGHGMAEAREGSDVRAHRFFGSYQKVVRSLGSLGKRSDGLVIGGGVRRSKTTGLVIGFK
ncbi:hint-domain-containing protein, partial [Diaporthe sp. PMI_573]